MNRDLLRRLNDSTADLAARCREDFEAGEAVADEEIRGLADLAQAIGRGLVEWRSLSATLALAAPLDARRAGTIVIETVFDEVLAPDAWRVLADAFAMTELDAPATRWIENEGCP
ncbi:MAG TPA: hypothetical protein VGF42_03570 [Caulobacteraceae bacterium]|jgi:hypothetical protein